MDRRELLIGAGSLVAASLVWRELLAGTPGNLTGDASEFLGILCDLVIPDTATPGARKAGVPEFLTLALKHRLAGASNDDLAALQTRLDQQSGGSFVHLTAGKQQSVLAATDSQDVSNPATPWARMKKLILMGYYTSEIGASQELQYQLVPGRFDPDVPVKPGDRAWSSDWIGQGF